MVQKQGQKYQNTGQMLENLSKYKNDAKSGIEEGQSGILGKPKQLDAISQSEPNQVIAMR